MTDYERLRLLAVQVSASHDALLFVDKNFPHDYDRLKSMFEGVLADIADNILQGLEEHENNI